MAYAASHPEEPEIMTVADPNPVRRQTAKERHALPDDRLYSHWEDLAQQPRNPD